MATILVVEDEPAVAEVTALILEEAGYKVLTAHDGIDALEKMQQTVPDLVLTDSMMPRMDGQTLVKAMRANPRLAGVRVVVMSAHRPALNIDGVNERIAKPYDVDALLRLIEDLLPPDTARADRARE